VLQNVFVDNHIRVVQVQTVLVDDFFDSHGNSPVSSLIITKTDRFSQIFAGTNLVSASAAARLIV
jgi:hypothetical protein